jgi:hypothetical protein
VCLALDIVENARVTGADAVGYDSTLGRAVLTFRVPAKTELKRDVDISQGVVRNLTVPELSWWYLRDASRESNVPAAQRAILARAADAAYALAIRNGALPKREADVAQLLKDIDRLQDHLRVTLGNSDDAHLAAVELRAGELRLSALRARIDTLKSEIGIFANRQKATLSALGARR